MSLEQSSQKKKTGFALMREANRVCRQEGE